MNSIIIYATRHGCSEKAAQILAKQLPSPVKFVHLKTDKLPNLDEFDTIIVGGSIHAGRIQSSIKKFCQAHTSTLLAKKLGLYLCCMEEGEKAESQFDNAYPAQLREHATASGLFGGAFDFEKMNFFERAIIKKIAKISQSISKINEQAIKEFAQKMTTQAD